MREKLQRFMQGRNGYDAFSRFLIWAGLILLMVSLLTGRLVNGTLSSILWTAAIVATVYSYFRIFSRNIYRRQAENAKYQQIWGRVKAWFRGIGQRWRDRKLYRYFRCPSCRTLMRAPRGKGRIRVTCKSCGTKFETNT